MTAPAMNIIEALDDPALFAPHFQGDTWDAWRVFLAALFGLPMDDAALATFRHHTERQSAPERPFREAALVIGRRGGKSRVLGLLAVFLGCFRDYAPYLAPGEVATIPIIAADRKQSRSIFRFMLGLLRSVPLLAGMLAAETGDSVTLTNGVVIEIHTASFRVTRGYSLAAALCDEAAFWRSDESANPDTEILAALRPGLSNIPGAMLLMASSPYARRGALWQAFRDHYGRDDARVLVWRGTTAEMNPKIDPAIIAAAYEEDPANAAAEYGAEFRTDIAAFITREVVEGCTATGRREQAPMAGCRYVAFCDPSGGSADSMTLAIAHQASHATVLDAVREVRPPFSPEAVVRDFAATLKMFGLSKVSGDRYAGEWPRERFSEHGVAYELSDRPKSDIYRDALPLLNSAKVELLDLPRLAGQLCNLERRTSRGGRDSIDHPPGGHDDVANAAMGALLLASGKGPQPARALRIDFIGR
jgi:hypothetical protein